MSTICHKPTDHRIYHLLTQLALITALTIGLLLASPTPINAAPPIKFNCAIVTEIPQAECVALVALYNSTNGPEWSNANDWLSSSTPCAWAGIACNAGSVSGLGLGSNHMSGTLPAELGHLSHLQRLPLYDNQLSGSIPPEVGNLTALQLLDLSANQLSGSIPAELGHLTNLQQLLLYDNQLSGSIPPELGNLVSLQYMWLNHNQLSGSIPPQLGDLANLQRLSLYNNQLSGSIPTELGNLTNLQDLYLDSNQFSGNIPAELGNLTNLEAIDLFNNRLSGSIPATLCLLPLDFGANFDYNQLTASDPCLTAKDPNWAQTQTVPPTNVQAQAFANQQVQLTWTPITYTADGGYYTLLAGVTAGGPYTVVGQTADKTASGLILAPLGPGTHHLVVRTFTPQHGGQQNDLTSDNSHEVVVVFNTPPLATSETVTATQGSALSISLDASDVDTDTLSYSLVSLPIHGLLRGTAPTLTYTAAAGFIGTDSFTYKASDGKTDSNVATVTIQVMAPPPVNTPPVANSQTLTIAQNSARSIALIGGDADGDALTYTLLTQPGHGLLGGVAPNLTYTPAAGFSGLDSFTFQVNDGQADSPPATVTIHVNATPSVNTPPVANGQTVTTTQATRITITLSAADGEGDPLTYQVISQPAHGILGGMAPALVYTPTPGYNGADSFTYQVHDGQVDSAAATVQINVTTQPNRPPTAQEDAFTVTRNSQGTVLAVLANDHDLDGDGLTLVAVAAPTHGTAQIVNGQVRYTPAADFVGGDQFTYTLSDGKATVVATVSVTVTASQPVAQAVYLPLVQR